MNDRPESHEPNDSGATSPSRVPTIAALLGALALAGMLIVRAGGCGKGPPAFEAPPEMLRGGATFPGPAAELRPSIPLAPLLARDEPDRLAVLEPAAGAIHLPRGTPLTLRFNRPMVDGAIVGKQLDDIPLVFTPTLKGTARWTTRSSLSFEPEASSWSRSHAVRVSLGAQVRSLAGESIEEFEPRSAVLDATPRLLSSRRQRRLSLGEPLLLRFDSRVEPAWLSSRMLVYEVEGGRRSLPFTVAARPADDEGAIPVEVRWNEKLEPGARIAVALAPAMAGGGSDPEVIEYELSPRPSIEGIDCQPDATEPAGCRYAEPPGAVVDIAESLVLLSSTPLGDVPSSAVQVTPPLSGMQVRLEDARRIVLRGDFAPGQVYQLRIGELKDQEGIRLTRTAPLAIRSAGRSAEVRVQTGRLVFERDARAELPFAAIAVDRALIQIEDVPRGQEYLPAVGLGSRFSEERKGRWKDVPLGPLAPDARANRWGRGRVAWRDSAVGVSSNMALVSFVPDSDKPGLDQRATAFVQSTDLGLEAKALDKGVLVWVTSLASARPVSAARVTIADMSGRELGNGAADNDGVAWLALPRNPTLDGVLVKAEHGDDRAIVVVDPRTSMGPGHVGVASGAPRNDSLPVASVFADRDACRPGEVVHVKTILRKVQGATLLPLREGQVRFVLYGPAGQAAVLEKNVSLSAFGTASADIPLAEDAPVGAWRVEVVRDGVEQPIATRSFTVGEFRQPVFRVELQGLVPVAIDGAALEASIEASYLFGAPAAGARARWSLSRSSGGKQLPARWEQYTFAPVDAVSRGGTMDSGEATLGPEGTAAVRSRFTLSAPVRESASLEVTVQDASGKTTSTRKRVELFPASAEVGIRERPQWAPHGTELDVEAVVIGNDGAPIEGTQLEARIVREGWSSYWEWSDRSRGDEEEPSGAYRARRSRQRQVVHTCKLKSAAEPVHCTFTPARPGTYLLEASAEDAEGRSTIASQRIYVAGPDERPDRDPPGSPLAITPTRYEWNVGETAELAVESPFSEAEALVTVERDAVLFSERRRLTAGGHVLRVPLTAAMVPNAYVSVTLVKPRTGVPGAELDLHAPDWRVGMTELQVRPTESPISVVLGLPADEVPAGVDVPIQVRVHDGSGSGVASEIALYAVDEGTLRLTAYQTPDPVRGLFPRRPASFHWEGIRRSLVSRIEQDLVPSSGGDGGGEPAAPSRELRDRFDPTPLWSPALLTDASGSAQAVLHLPRRAARYRVMAVAVDAGMRSGRAEGWIQARRVVVPRTALPRFVTEGDRFEAALLLHNGGDGVVDATVTSTVGGQPRAPQQVRIEPNREVRLAQWVDAAVEPIPIRFQVQAGAETETIDETVAVQPRARRERAEAVGAVSGSRRIAVDMPAEALSRDGRLSMTIASHPFVAFDMSVETLSAFPYGGVEAISSSVLGLAAYASLDTGRRPASASPKELRARAESALRQLRAMQTPSGGFGWASSTDELRPYTTAYALHAMEAARALGWDPSTASRERATSALSDLVRGSGFVDASADDGRNDLAFALRVLAEAGAQEDARVTALFEQRELLSPYGLAQLAMAMQDGDRRRDPLVLEAQRRVLATRQDERATPSVLRWYESSTRTVAAVLEASSRVDAGADKARLLASKILEARGVQDGRSWWSTHETSCALAGLAAYAQRFKEGRAIRPRVILDGIPLEPRESRDDIAWYSLPFESVAQGGHNLDVQGDGLMFYALSGEWWSRLGQQDSSPRGQDVALHRVFETGSGVPVEPGAKVHLGDLIRVRLFTFDEHDTPPFVVLRDNLGGGLEPIQDAFETSPLESLRALLGMGPDDDAADPRGFHALRSVGDIESLVIDERAVVLRLRPSGAGLREFTYGVRASAVGTFTLAPAQLEALYVPDYVARSAMTTLEVIP